MNSNTSFSLEIFPPKNDVGIEAIYKNLYDFAKIAPDYISVTYAAGGDGGTGTADIASVVQNEHNIKAIAHVRCMGETKESVGEILDDLVAHGIKSVLALRGDRKQDAELTDFKYATDLISFMKDKWDFEIFATCYPEGHVESENYLQDVSVMKKKYDLGVTRFVSQLFFDNEDFYKMRDEAVKIGVNAPIVAGIMPITNAKQILRTVSMCGAKIPTRLSKLISKFEDNPDALRQAGLNFAIEQITDLISNDVDGIHLYTMNNPSTAKTIFDNISTILSVVNK